MKISLSLDQFDAASRRLAMNAARRAEAIVHPAEARIVVSEERTPPELGADAWPGAMPPGLGAAPSHRGARP